MEIRDFFKKIKGKVLIVGVGNRLRGDDAVGSYIVNKINKKNPGISLIDCEDTPERFLDKIIQYKPDTIVFIDALEMKAQPGCVCIITDEELESSTILTHRISLNLLFKYIKLKIDSKIIIIGIQPKNKEIGSTMSKEVTETANFIANLLVERFENEKDLYHRNE